MIALSDTASVQKALTDPHDPALLSILHLRMVQLTEHVECDLSELVHFLIVEPGDPPTAVAALLGFSLLVNLVDGAPFGSPGFEPSWEWIERHDSGWFEFVFILSDDGFGWTVLIPDCPGVDADLLALCRHYT